MLKVCKMKDNAAALAEYYAADNSLDQKRAGYYADQAKTGVTVHGQGAGAFGFRPGEEVSQDDLENAFNFCDRSGIFRRKYKSSVRAWDFTRSVEKTGTILATTQDGGAKLAGAFENRGAALMQAIIERFGTVQITEGDKQQSTKMLWFSVLDDRARPVIEYTYTQDGKDEKTYDKNKAKALRKQGVNVSERATVDPDLHQHNPLVNMAVGPGAQVYPLDMYRFMQTKGAMIFFGEFDESLFIHDAEKLGHPYTYVGGGQYRFDQVSPEVRAEFSKRSKQIAENEDKADAEHYGRLKKEMFKGDIVDDWRTRLAECEKKDILFQQAAKTEEGRAYARDMRLKANRNAYRQEWETFIEQSSSAEAKQERAGTRDGATTEIEMWRHATERSIEHHNNAGRYEVMAEYVRERRRHHLPAMQTVEEIEQRLQQAIDAEYISEVAGGRITLDKRVRIEMENVRGRREQTQGGAFTLEAHTTAAALREWQATEKAAGRSILSEQQSGAVSQTFTSGRFIDVWQGHPGAGKTRTLRAVNQIAEYQGWTVYGLSTTRKAVKELERGAAVKHCTTLASYLLHERKNPNEKRLLIIDEFSTMGTETMHRIIDDARRHGDKIILVGDENQLLSIEAGTEAHNFVNDAKKTGALIELTENYRQETPELRNVAELLRAGKHGDALDQAQTASMVTENEDTETLIDAISERYAAAANRGGVLVTAKRRQDCHQLNERIRDRLIERGDVRAAGGRDVATVYEHLDGTTESRSLNIAPGDTIIFTANNWRADLSNGDRADVLEVYESEGRTTLDVKIEGLDGHRIIDTMENQHIERGYAVTTYKAQGSTFDDVLIYAPTEKETRAMREFYVQATRAKKNLTIYTDDLSDLREIVGRDVELISNLDDPRPLEYWRALEEKNAARLAQERAARTGKLTDYRNLPDETAETPPRISQDERTTTQAIPKTPGKTAERVRVYNLALIESAGKSTIYKAQYEDTLFRAQETLNASTIDTAGRGQIAEYLNSQGAGALEILKKGMSGAGTIAEAARRLGLADAPSWYDGCTRFDLAAIKNFQEAETENETETEGQSQGR